MRNQRGVTLIALVITIIVLLILAGVSIAMLTGDNGILTQANKAQVTTIEGNVAEAVRLAVQAVKMDAEQKAISNAREWRAEKNTTDIIALLQKDLPITNYEITGTNASDGVQTTDLTIKYKGADYKKATNKTDASITYTVTLSGTTFTIDDTVVYVPAHEE